MVATDQIHTQNIHRNTKATNFLGFDEPNRIEITKVSNFSSRNYSSTKFTNMKRKLTDLISTTKDSKRQSEVLGKIEATKSSSLILAENREDAQISNPNFVFKRTEETRIF